MIKQKIDTDIKSAMLSGDKETVTILRTIKSVILNAEVNSGKRGAGLTDDEIIGLLQREVKKRKDAAELYKNANDQARAAKENLEIEIVSKYLPTMLSEDEISSLVDVAIGSMESVSTHNMGQIIGMVKSKAGPLADGAIIARLVKEKITAK